MSYSAIVAVLVLALNEPAPDNNHITLRTDVGKCEILSVARAADHSGWHRGDRTGFGAVAYFVRKDRKTYLIAPFDNVASLSFAHFTMDSPVEAVLLTSLDPREASATRPNRDDPKRYAKVFVDRTILDRSRSGNTAAVGRDTIAEMATTGQLNVVEPNVRLYPGIRFLISPHRPSGQSEIEIDCGDATLLIVGGGAIDLPGLKPTQHPASLNGLAPPNDRWLRDEYIIAATTGPFPALGRVYRHADGLHWGSVIPADLPRRRSRPTVTVELPRAEEPRPSR